MKHKENTSRGTRDAPCSTRTFGVFNQVPSVGLGYREGSKEDTAWVTDSVCVKDTSQNPESFSMVGYMPAPAKLVFCMALTCLFTHALAPSLTPD